MATPLGHSLMGLAIYAATVRSSDWLRKWGWLFLVVLFSAGADLDYIPAAFGRLDLAETYHRGFSHTILLAVIATAIYLIAAKAAKRPRPFLWAAVLFSAFMSHFIIDIFTVDTKPPYGIAIFRPFSGIHLYSRFAFFPKLMKSSYSELFSTYTLRIFLFETIFFMALITVIAFTHIAIEKRRRNNGQA